MSVWVRILFLSFLARVCSGTGRGPQEIHFALSEEEEEHRQEQLVIPYSAQQLPTVTAPPTLYDVVSDHVNKVWSPWFQSQAQRLFRGRRQDESLLKSFSKLVFGASNSENLAHSEPILPLENSPQAVLPFRGHESGHAQSSLIPSWLTDAEINWADIVRFKERFITWMYYRLLAEESSDATPLLPIMNPRRAEPPRKGWLQTAKDWIPWFLNGANGQWTPQQEGVGSHYSATAPPYYLMVLSLLVSAGCSGAALAGLCRYSCRRNRSAWTAAEEPLLSA